MTITHQRALDAARELGIPIEFVTRCRMPAQMECGDLVSIGIDVFGREQHLERTTATRWEAMRQAAREAEVILQAVSAFRSFDYQKQIIARKLASGQTIEEILQVSALPGFSEHHTGRAIDITTPGCEPLTESFENTDAFKWLSSHAGEFGFRLSYPRNNQLGVIYEPWHWFLNDARA